MGTLERLQDVCTDTAQRGTRLDTHASPPWLLYGAQLFRTESGQQLPRFSRGEGEDIDDGEEGTGDRAYLGETVSRECHLSQQKGASSELEGSGKSQGYG